MKFLKMFENAITSKKKKKKRVNHLRFWAMISYNYSKIINSFSNTEFFKSIFL